MFYEATFHQTITCYPPQNLDYSSLSTDKSTPEEETCNEEPSKERKEEKSEILQVQQPEEAKPKAAETPEAPKTKDEKQKTSTEVKTQHSK